MVYTRGNANAHIASSAFVYTPVRHIVYYFNNTNHGGITTMDKRIYTLYLYCNTLCFVMRREYNCTWYSNPKRLPQTVYNYYCLIIPRRIDAPASEYANSKYWKRFDMMYYNFNIVALAAERAADIPFFFKQFNRKTRRDLLSVHK